MKFVERQPRFAKKSAFAYNKKLPFGSLKTE
jgi:hypothetical protein